MNTAEFQDELWLRAITHGRGLDTLPVEVKQGIQSRFSDYGTAGLFPDVQPRPLHDGVRLAPNLTIGEPGDYVRGTHVFLSALIPPTTLIVEK